MGKSQSVGSWGSFLDKLNGNLQDCYHEESLEHKFVYIYSHINHTLTLYIFDSKTRIFHILISYEVRGV